MSNESDEASQEAFTLKCVITGFERAVGGWRNASSWLGFLCTLWVALPDWHWLTDCASGRRPKGVNRWVSACVCLSMRLSGDKSTDVCQIDRTFLSIKALGYVSLEACQRSGICGLHIWFKWRWFLTHMCTRTYIYIYVYVSVCTESIYASTYLSINKYRYRYT